METQTQNSSKENSTRISLSSAVTKSRQLIAANYPAYYLARFFHRNEKGGVLDLKRCPALLAFLLDDSKKKVAMKCVQIGVSELLFVSCFAKALRGWSLLYSLPTIELKNTVVANRIDKSIVAVPVYRTSIKQSTGDSDSRSLKHLGKGAIKFVGSNSQTAFIEFPADMVIIDEKDKSNIENLKLAPDRLDASPHKYLWTVGNPTFVKYGVHADFLESDQKEWHIRCESCGQEQSLDWFKNVVEKTGEHEYKLLDCNWRPTCGRDIKVLCRGCRRELNRVGPGRWIAQNPLSNISGYHMSQLFSPTVTVEKLWNQFQAGLSDPTEMQRFFNSGLGLPYDAVSDNITEALLEAKCMSDYLMPSVASGCTMGVDVGGKLHVRISEYPESGIRKAVYINAVHSWDELGSLIERYKVRLCVIDAEPELHKVREFQARHPDVVWLCDYATGDKIDFWTLNEELQTMRVDRTASIDGMVAGILSGKMRLPKDFKGIDQGEYVEHMEAPKRKLIQERGADGSMKKPRYVWEEGGSADHYFHAENYDNLAFQLMNLMGSRENDMWWVK